MSVPTKVYCAGPLFNDSERAEMESIAATLEKAGFLTFLPHRDGIRVAEAAPAIVSQADATESDALKFLEEVVFLVDVYQVTSECDALVVNLNGRVPDEGAVVEAAIAWASGKHVVAFKNDVRTLANGLCNPLVSGLAAFVTVSSVEEVPQALMRAAAADREATVESTASMHHVKRLGGRFSQLLQASNGTKASALVDLFGAWHTNGRRFSDDIDQQCFLGGSSNAAEEVQRASRQPAERPQRVRSA